jgi:hypothetical protein
MSGFIKIAHELNGDDIVDRPKRHQEVLGAGLHKAPAQAHHTFAGFGFARSGVTSGKGNQPGALEVQGGHIFGGEDTVVVHRRGLARRQASIVVWALARAKPLRCMGF